MEIVSSLSTKIWKKKYFFHVVFDVRQARELNDNLLEELQYREHHYAILRHKRMQDFLDDPESGFELTESSDNSDMIEDENVENEDENRGPKRG